MNYSYSEDEIFLQQDFSKTRLTQGEYESCTFTNCDFAETDLSKFRFSECIFTDCNLSNCKLTGASFQEVKFKNSKMLGLLFDGCNSIGFSAQFENCRLDHSSFYNMDLRQCNFRGCHLTGVDFSEANLKDVSLLDCELLNATFSATDLQNADLRNSRNYSVDPETNRIWRAKFSLAEVVGLLEKYQIRVVD